MQDLTNEIKEKLWIDIASHIFLIYNQRIKFNSFKENIYLI